MDVDKRLNVKLGDVFFRNGKLYVVTSTEEYFVDCDTPSRASYMLTPLEHAIEKPLSTLEELNKISEWIDRSDLEKLDFINGLEYKVYTPKCCMIEKI